MFNDLKNHIRVAEGFQYSVNIGFDMDNDDKIKGFIPTTASLNIIEDLILSTFENSTDRARILVGAYGKGKSHIVLVLLSLLSRKEMGLFRDLLLQIKAYNNFLYEYVIDYINSDKKLLPIIIQGSSASLTQSFLGAMQKALDKEGFEDFMPETHFQAAIDNINTWESSYPDTYKKFELALNEPVTDFVLKLSEYDVNAYDKFVSLYPSLTSGSAFNPFLGLDVIELYTNVIEKLQTKGYNGVFVVYDEFSKFLEAGITKVSSVDIKLLQDFAEKCNRSKDKQMHLLLISHKDISNYIDKLPKQKVDGWKGVSERFKHIEVRNNYSQVYQIIATVIQKEELHFAGFFGFHADKVSNMVSVLGHSDMFSELEATELSTVVEGCYPLHPVSTFILPRLSEKVAQNERTLFTFLSSQNNNTLWSFVQNASGEFPILTPDYLYDYFEPLLKKEVYISDIHKIYMLTTNILGKLPPNSLGSKIVKTLALIYITGQFDKLPPIPDVIVNTFRESVTDISEITNTLHELQDKQFVIYMKKSNNYLRLKNSVSIDLGSKISDAAERAKAVHRVKDIVNNALLENYMYPTSYNDDFEITRYFDFVFIGSNEFLTVENWNKKISDISGDGVIYGIITENEEEIQVIREMLLSNKACNERTLFVLPQNNYEIEKIAFEYQAVKLLKEQNSEDESLVEEFNIYLEDLEEVLNTFISAYTKPEMRQAEYFYMGEKRHILRKAQISQLLSKICSAVYTHTPIINNEAINKDFLPTVAVNSRSKVISGLLSNQLAPNLGLVGTGQDISIMRSTLVMTGILCDFDTHPRLIISGNKNVNMQNALDEIVSFVKGTSENRVKSFRELYDKLTLPQYHIGLKKGVIPIYIAVVLHFFKRTAVIMRGNRELQINAELLNSINQNPADYSVCLEDWDEEKNNYIAALEELFADDILFVEKEYNTFAYIVKAMQRWFIKLPPYAKEAKQKYEGLGRFKKIETQKLRYISSLKVAEINAREYLFVKVFSIFNLSTITTDVVDNIQSVKALLDCAKDDLIKALEQDVRMVFRTRQLDKSSLSSDIKDWYEGLKNTTKNHVFKTGEDRVLELMRTINGDDKMFIERLAKALTGLRTDDWDDKTVNVFLNKLSLFKTTVEELDKSVTSEYEKPGVNVYKLTFIDDEGQEKTKTFNKTDFSNKAKLLLNEIASAMEEYGQAISDSEKRQVLIEILEKLS